MAIIKIKIMVSEISSVLALFDHIEVQRSVSGPPSYTDAVAITADAPTAAQLVGANKEPFTNIQFRDLKLKVDGGNEQVISFTAAEPTSLSNIITQINNQIDGAIAANNGSGYLRLSTVAQGTNGILEITGGTGINSLGFAVGQKDNGEDEHIQLLPDVTSYEYQDRSGLTSNYYRTRYINETTGEYSSWSTWIQGTTGSAVGDANLIIGKIKLADIDGMALEGRSITVVNIYQPVLQDTYFMAGRSKTVKTDASGNAQITLVKGSKVDIVLEGTSVIRRILVPSSGTEFNLLDPDLQTDDPFGIQVPDLPAAARSS